MEDRKGVNTVTNQTATKDNPPRSFTAAFAGLIAAVRLLRDGEYKQLFEVSGQSNRRLQPLGEPLEHELGAHRWLASAREEAYSDWLAWLLSLMTITELWGVLHIPEPLPLGLDPSLKAVRSEREVWVEHGHKEREGRLDIRLRVHDKAVIVVELKRGAADGADLEKHPGYIEAIKKGFPKISDPHFILIATEVQPETNLFGFRFMPYSELCLRLRHLAVNWIDEHNKRSTSGKLFHAATALMVAAAIESNLLRMSLDKNSFTQATLSHLRNFNKGEQ